MGYDDWKCDSGREGEQGDGIDWEARDKEVDRDYHRKALYERIYAGLVVNYGEMMTPDQMFAEIDSGAAAKWFEAAHQLTKTAVEHASPEDLDR